MFSGSNTEANNRIQELEDQLAQLKLVQAKTLPLVHRLPDSIRGLIDANTIGSGTLSDDGLGMSYEIGGNILLAIRPTNQSITLSDITGKNEPLKLSIAGDFDRNLVLQIAGYAALAQRDGVGQTTTDWAKALNGQVTTAV